MDSVTTGSESLETREDAGEGPSGEYRFWTTQLKLAEKEQEAFQERGKAIVDRYRDKRGDDKTLSSRAGKFNILWANVETLKPILYGRTPKPDVERRHKDDDPIARLGAEVMERALSYEDDLDEFDKVMAQVVEDRLLPGRGIARVYFEPEYGDPEDDPSGEIDDDGKKPQFRPVKNECAPVKYVFWQDYRESPARIYEEVWWVAFRSYMTRDELVKRFGDKVGNAVTLDYSPKGLDEKDGGPQADAFKKAEVWEIWDKRKKEAVWISKGYNQEVLDKKPDPLELPTFFPSPRPLSATTTNETQIPVADYYEYQDQALELDKLTGRIDRLTSALKVVGLYPGSSKAEIQQLLNGDENRMIPVEDWQAVTDKGGLQNMIHYLPIQQVADVLIRLYDARDRVLRTLYQITGMADILRGETDPNETLGAQQLKSQFATRRISQAQKDVARFARDLIRLRGFVMGRWFSPETFSQMSGYPLPMPPLPPAPPQLIPAPPPQPMQPPQGMAPQGMAA